MAASHPVNHRRQHCRGTDDRRNTSTAWFVRQLETPFRADQIIDKHPLVLHWIPESCMIISLGGDTNTQLKDNPITIPLVGIFEPLLPKVLLEAIDLETILGVSLTTPLEQAMRYCLKVSSTVWKPARLSNTAVASVCTFVCASFESL